MPGSPISRTFWPWLMPGFRRPKRLRRHIADSSRNLGNTLTRLLRVSRAPNMSVRLPKGKPDAAGQPRRLRGSIVTGCRLQNQKPGRTISTFSTNPSGLMPRVEECLHPFRHREKHPRDAQATQGNRHRAMPGFREGGAGTATDAPSGVPCRRAAQGEALMIPKGMRRTSTPNAAHGREQGKRSAGKEGVRLQRDGKGIL